jgi:hypothetical protein
MACSKSASRFALVVTLAVAITHEVQAAAPSPSHGSPSSGPTHGVIGNIGNLGNIGNFGTNAGTNSPGTNSPGTNSPGASSPAPSSSGSTSPSPTHGVAAPTPSPSPTHSLAADPSSPTPDPASGRSASSFSYGGAATGDIFDAIFYGISFSNPVSAVDSASQQAQDQIAVCERNNFDCVADVLDTYADALRKLAPSLPPALQSLPDVVSRAATQVRHAKTRAQAAKAMNVAIAEIHKTIALIKAGDRIVVSYDLESREATSVVNTLEVARDKLEKATGL